MRLLFDLEGDGLLETGTKVHCVAVINVDTEERYDFKPDQLADALKLLDQATVLIGHNIQRFDIPYLKKIMGWAPKPEVRVIDTMITARLIYPNVKATDPELIRKGQMPPGRKHAGKHTLAAWGFRLGEQKGDYSEVKEAEALALGFTDEEAIKRYVWCAWNQEMHDYMIQDVETNLALWRKLKVDKYSQDAIALEHRAARVCDAINEAGVPFSKKKAGALHAQLMQKKAAVEARLIEEFGFWLQPVSPDPTKAEFIPKKVNKKLGYGWGPSSDCWTYTDERGRERTQYGYPCTKLKPVTFNPGSRDHIAKVLVARGWEPTKFTDGGKPQINEEAIEGIVQRFPEMDGIGDYLMLEKRLSQLAEGKQAWLLALQPDGRIHGVINPMGTITSRGSHFLPNLGQVPNMASPFGPECRDCFDTGDFQGVFLGADMSGLELRGLGHYLAPLDGGSYMTTAVSGDIHWVNAIAMGLAEGERDKAPDDAEPTPRQMLHTIIREDGSKRFIYAYIYGCGDGMAGEIILNCLTKAKREGGEEGAALYEKFFGKGVPGEAKLKRVGAKVREGFLHAIDGFSDLKAKLGLQVEQYGWVPGLDGRRIPVRSEHSALNFMIQSCGAILCKRWMCDVFDELCARFKLGVDFQFVLWVHDELQLLVRREIVEEVKEVIKRHAANAGTPYGFRGPLKADAKTGASWKDTH